MYVIVSIKIFLNKTYCNYLIIILSIIKVYCVTITKLSIIIKNNHTEINFPEKILIYGVIFFKI